jgi:hypothetical protein
MYSTCLYCNARLGANETLEGFPVGRRIAFDAAKGRLWVVCDECRRWNLTPMEERFEAIEDCERLYRGTHIRVSTDNIGLARMRDGLELVRIGSPLRPEFAAWRYAGEFFSRRSRSQLRAGATVAGAMGVSAGLGIVLAPLAAAAGSISVVALPAIAMTMVSTTVLGKAMAKDYMEYERVLGRFRVDERVITVRAKHARSIELGFHGDDDAELGLQHDRGWTTFHGTRAMHATTVLLANTNRGGASTRVVQSAVDQIERAGDSTAYLDSASRRNGWRGLRPVSVLNAFRKLGPMNLTSTERLALEMAVHEETERRAIQGELQALTEAWAEAEQIASIVDGMLTPLQ